MGWGTYPSGEVTARDLSGSGEQRSQEGLGTSVTTESSFLTGEKTGAEEPSYALRITVN